MNKNEIILPIEGMTCDNCERLVGQALRQVEGVTHASVNLATQSAKVEILEADVKIRDLVQAVQNIGYQIPTENIILQIEGMTCFDCFVTVDDALSKVPGVVNVNVSLAREKARVSFVPGVASLQDFEQAVAETGKRVLGVLEEGSSPSLPLAL